MNTHLSAVQQTLALASPALSAEQITAFNYSLGWSQAVARKGNNDPSQWSYFQAMTGEMSGVGWNVLAADTLSYAQQGETVTPASVISQMMSGWIDTDSQMRINSLMGMMSSGNPPQGLASLLGFWWSNVQTNTTNLTISPLVLDTYGSVSTTMLLLGFNYASTNWQSLFLSRRSDQLQVTARRLQVSLNMTLFKQNEGLIKNKLNQSSMKFISELDLDL